MKKIPLLFLALILLSGCASIAPVGEAVSSTDEFSGLTVNKTELGEIKSHFQYTDLILEKIKNQNGLEGGGSERYLLTFRFSDMENRLFLIGLYNPVILLVDDERFDFKVCDESPIGGDIDRAMFVSNRLVTCMYRVKIEVSRAFLEQIISVHNIRFKMYGYKERNNIEGVITPNALRQLREALNN